MLNRCSVRLYVALTVLLFSSAAPAFAQFQPRSLNDPATGEKFHIEAAADIWVPSADLKISSEGLGIEGDVIDAKSDLGLKDHKFSILEVVFKPARKHKLRLQYLPIKYEQEATLKRKIIYNGQAYNIGVPVISSLEWKQTHLSYEYDFLVKDRGFGGFILDAKLTDVETALATPIISESAKLKAPVPTIGGIARFYPVPNISVTTEITGVSVPSSLSEKYNGDYLDVDIYGTLNLTNNVGAKFGYRSIDLGLVIDKDTGDLKMQGIYFGIVARY